MTENNNAPVNLGYTGQYEWGLLEARATIKKTRHEMQFGDDKQYYYGDPATIPGMPMDTKANLTGVVVSADIDLPKAIFSEWVANSNTIAWTIAATFRWQHGSQYLREYQQRSTGSLCAVRRMGSESRSANGSTCSVCVTRPSK